MVSAKIANSKSVLLFHVATVVSDLHVPNDLFPFCLAGKDAQLQYFQVWSVNKTILHKTVCCLDWSLFVILF